MSADDCDGDTGRNKNNALTRCGSFMQQWINATIPLPDNYNTELGFEPFSVTEDENRQGDDDNQDRRRYLRSRSH